MSSCNLRDGKVTIKLLFGLVTILLLALITISIWYAKRAVETQVAEDQKTQLIDENAEDLVMDDGIGNIPKEEELGRHYTSDENGVYYNGEIIEGADPNTFQFLGESAFGFYELMVFAKDAQNVYRWNEPLDMDPNSFELLKKRYYKDKFSVYYQAKKIDGADPESFTVPEEGHVYDTNFLYVGSTPISKNKPGIEIIGYYAISDESVTYKMEEMANSDPTTFEFLGGVGEIITWDGYAKDRNAVYFKGKIVEGADVDSFHLMEEPFRVGYGEDEYNKYDHGKKVQNDFELCSTDISSLPEGSDYWSDKLANIVTDTRGFEFCRKKNGGTLIAFAGGDVKVKLFYWFNESNELINTVPTKFICGEKGMPMSPQAIEKLSNNKVSLFCTGAPEHKGPCAVTELYELDLDTFKISPSDDYYDCGYRG